MKNSRRVLIILALAFAVVIAIGMKNSAREGNFCFFGWCKTPAEVNSAQETDPELVLPVEINEPESEAEIEAETVTHPEKVEIAVEASPAPAAKAPASSHNPAKQDRPVIETPPADKQESPKPKKVPRLVELGSETCVPCQMMVPVLEELRTEYKGRLEVIVVDVNKDRKTAQQYRVRMIPTQVFIDPEGNEIARHQGFIPKDRIVATFEEHGVKL